MADLVIRDLDPEVMARLRRRAAANGRSMDAEARATLQDAVGNFPPARRLATFIHEQFAAAGGAKVSIPARDDEARSADLA